MEKNMSEIDSGARVIIGILLAIIYTGYAGIVLFYPVNWVVLVLAVIMLVSGIIGFCPIYKLLHISTRKPKTVEIEKTKK